MDSTSPVSDHIIEKSDHMVKNSALCETVQGHNLQTTNEPKSLNFQATKALWANIENPPESLSDFRSCKGSSDSESGSNLASQQISQAGKKRGKKKKRKHGQSPEKEEFLRKKPNVQQSPQ